VEFKTRQEIEGGISFTIENTVKEMPDINKIFQKSYSTKGDNRGMGLWIIKNIIRKNKNIILNTYCKDNKFIQELIVS
jgi:two-component system sensor histidine kinase AgrC